MGRGNHLGESGRHYESAAPAVVSPFQIARLASRPVRPHTGLMPTYTMSRQGVVVLYVMAMVAIIVALDFVFFRNRFWERLMMNIGIVLVFAAFYFRFLKPS